MSCGVGRRGGSDPQLLWLWCRLADVASIRPLAWEPPYAVGGRPKKRERERERERESKVEEGLSVLKVMAVSSLFIS